MARFLARSIILSRSLDNAFLLSLSRSAGIDEKACNIAMSFASARLTFNNCSSCSILSNVKLDKSFSTGLGGGDYSGYVVTRGKRNFHTQLRRAAGTSPEFSGGEERGSERRLVEPLPALFPGTPVRPPAPCSPIVPGNLSHQECSAGTCRCGGCACLLALPQKNAERNRAAVLALAC